MTAFRRSSCGARRRTRTQPCRRRWTRPCYDPSNVQNTASFAFYDYFLKHGLSEDSCYFDNAAAITSLNPSHDNSKFPSSSTGSNGSFSGSTSLSLGKGPSEDISGCSRVAWRSWFRPLITSHL